jgi:hypothetical protein
MTGGRGENHDFEASLGYIARFCFKNKVKTKKEKGNIIYNKLWKAAIRGLPK